MAKRRQRRIILWTVLIPLIIGAGYTIHFGRRHVANERLIAQLEADEGFGVGRSIEPAGPAFVYRWLAQYGLPWFQTEWIRVAARADTRAALCFAPLWSVTSTQSQVDFLNNLGNFCNCVDNVVRAHLREFDARLSDAAFKIAWIKCIDLFQV